MVRRRRCRMIMITCKEASRLISEGLDRDLGVAAYPGPDDEPPK